jgi:hypothetical protein
MKKKKKNKSIILIKENVKHQKTKIKVDKFVFTLVSLVHYTSPLLLLLLLLY